MEAILPNGLSIRHLYDVAHRQALRIGMRYDDAEDCAQEFVLRMLRRYLHVLREKFAQANFPFWLKRCAHNHALNFLRKLAWSYMMERSLSALTDTTDFDFADSSSAPEALVFQAEFWKRIYRAVAQLAPMQKAMFLRRHLDSENIHDLAISTGQTPNAVYQVLFRARERLRSLLERQGCTEDILFAYLRAMPQISHQDRRG